MKIKLKPFFTFDPSGAPACVRSENVYIPIIEPEAVALMTRLIEGVEASAITPEDFKVLERFNEQGMITFIDHPSHGMIGLHDVDLRTSLELLNNVTVKIVDMIGEHHEYFAINLGELGVKLVDENPALTIVIVDSFVKLPDATGPTLPVIMNRFRPSIGPLMTPWRQNIAGKTKSNVAYMPEPNVKLPRVYNDLQRAWAVANIFQFIVRTETSKVNNVVEFNMAKMKQDWWPVQL